MGTDINCVIAHQLRFPPQQSLPDEMAAEIRQNSPFLRSAWAWKPDYNAESDFRVVQNNGGHSVWIARHLAVITTGVGWHDVARKTALRDQIVLSVSAIAEFFESSHMVFLPDDVQPWHDIQDSILHESWTFDQLLGHLRELGEALPDFASAIQLGSDEMVSGYLIVATREAVQKHNLRKP